MLKGPAALLASVAVRGALHAGWKLVTGASRRRPPATLRASPLGTGPANSPAVPGALK
jgi:hypothetical protein